LRLRAATLSGLALLMLVAFPTVSSATETLGPVTEYAVPGGQVFALAWGPDGNLWFTGSAGGVGRMTPTGQFSSYAVPNNAGSAYITAGPDGNMW
jgi:streptogramin lyase